MLFLIITIQTSSPESPRPPRVTLHPRSEQSSLQQYSHKWKPGRSWHTAACKVNRQPFVYSRPRIVTITELTNIASTQGYSVTGEMSRERTTTLLDDRADVTTSSPPTPRHLRRRRRRRHQSVPPQSFQQLPLAPPRFRVSEPENAPAAAAVPEPPCERRCKALASKT